MTALYVVLIILALLILLSLIRFGARVTYGAEGFAVGVKVLGFTIPIYPSPLTPEEQEKKARKKREKAAKKAAAQPEKAPDKPKKGGSLTLLMDLLPHLTAAAGKLFHKLRIDCLEAHIIWGASNPADAALGYGRASAAMGVLWGLIAPNFKVKKRDLTCDVDFDAPSPAVTLQAALTITVGQALALALPLLSPLMKTLRRRSEPAAHNLTKEA